eukprot:1143202-Pelagomonas_calceolata.AAC.13
MACASYLRTHLNAAYYCGALLGCDAGLPGTASQGRCKKRHAEGHLVAEGHRARPNRAAAQMAGGGQGDKYLCAFCAFEPPAHAPMKRKQKKNYIGRESSPYINLGKGDTLAQTSRDPPPPQGYRTENAIGDLEGCWKLPPPGPGCEEYFCSTIDE